MPIIFAVLFLVAPLYVWRFSIGGLPTNFLMLASFVVIAVAVVDLWRQGLWAKFLVSWRDLDRWLLSGIAAIGVASIASLFVFGVTTEKLAQWVVLYAQPLALFFLLRFYVAHSAGGESGSVASSSKFLEQIRLAAYIVVGAAGALAMVQYFTLLGLPPQWWGNSVEPKRAIAFFAHANAYALFVTPLLAWLLPDAAARFLTLWKIALQTPLSGWVSKVWLVNKALVFLWLLGGVGLFFSLSRGAWFGLLAAAVVFVLLSANKKLIIGFIVAMVVVLATTAAVPNLRYRLILPFYGEKSAVARISLWQTGASMIAANPILGKGINGFNYFWEDYNQDPNLEHYNFPHNIFLNFWVDLGLLGALGFLVVLTRVAWLGFWRKRLAPSRQPLALAALLFVVAIVVHGLIDIPYLKNDLALAFWLVLALSV
jgi:O-antigen ligase